MTLHGFTSSYISTASLGVFAILRIVATVSAPNLAKRLECARLSGAIECVLCVREREQAPALHTLREDRRCNATTAAGGFREAHGVRPACRRFRARLPMILIGPLALSSLDSL
jgi:hypothetical protein